jgi:hypothetical protein
MSVSVGTVMPVMRSHRHGHARDLRYCKVAAGQSINRLSLEASGNIRRVVLI